MAPIIVTLRPHKIPVKNGNPLSIPNAAPLAANAIGAGPGEPNKGVVVVIKTINAANTLLISINIDKAKSSPNRKAKRQNTLDYNVGGTCATKGNFQFKRCVSLFYANCYTWNELHE